VAATVHAWRALGARWIRVVDNGSSDATIQAATGAGAEVLLEPQRGYGAAAWRGLQRLPDAAEWILFSSADGSDYLTIEQVISWQAAVGTQADFVLGDRFTLPGARAHLKASQRFGNALACWLIALGWHRRFHDLGSLRLCRRKALEDLQLRDRGFGWNVEMQVRALERGHRIIELPVSYRPRAAGTSKISGNLRGIVRAGVGILGIIARLWLSRNERGQGLAG
jgi:hypothetical protein